MKHPDWNKMFSTDSAKAAKADEFGWLNAIHYMAPGRVAGVGNLCPHMSTMCSALCLGMYSGQASMVSDIETGINSVRQSRINKAILFMKDRVLYLNHMARQMFRIIKRAIREGLRACFRPNGSTDIPFERIKFALDKLTAKLLGLREGDRYTLLELFPDEQFVDYTKNFSRLATAPANLCLTFSFSGDNHEECKAALAAGHNVAVVFGHGLPDTFWGARVIDGDKHDLRHLDPRGVVVGLTPKGAKAKRSMNGFVVRDY
jgi:hypothetical protein